MMFALCLPTLNASRYMPAWVDAVLSQTVRPDRVLVIDSTSDDDTVAVARAAGFDVELVSRQEFGHGRTRQQALVELATYPIVVFMTQDAILASRESLARLIAAFDDPKVDVAYGRQIPHDGAGPFARHAREFNYPPNTEVRDLPPNSRPGIQVAFCSDSFAAYRSGPLLANGGFPEHVMFGEDMYVAAKCLMRGGRVAYVATATTRHSHDYTVKQDFRRYFDVGVFHKQEHWLLDELGRAEGRGAGFMMSELRYLARHSPRRIPEACVRLVARYAGYRAGLAEQLLPTSLKRRWSMCGHFKDRAAGSSQRRH